MNRFQKLIIFLFISFSLFLNFKNDKTSKCKKEEKINLNQIVAERKEMQNSYNICSGSNLINCIPPFRKYRQQYRISKSNSLLACVIEKNCSTFLTAILCYLHDPNNFLKNNRTLDRDIYGNRLCRNLNEFTKISKIPNHNKMKLFTVIRNPIDRFISGFVDKCLREKTWTKFKQRCCGCKTNLTCFVDKMYDRMVRFSKVSYPGIDFDDSHFFPQSWRCEFSTFFSKYQILKLDDDQFFDNLLNIFAEKNVEDKHLEFINKSLQQKTKHSTQESIERKNIENLIGNNQYLMKKLIQMYYFDFLLFGYSLPLIPMSE